jgi:hypothetical protein
VAGLAQLIGGLVDRVEGKQFLLWRRPLVTVDGVTGYAADKAGAAFIEVTAEVPVYFPGGPARPPRVGGGVGDPEHLIHFQGNGLTPPRWKISQDRVVYVALFLPLLEAPFIGVTALTERIDPGNQEGPLGVVVGIVAVQAGTPGEFVPVAEGMEGGVTGVDIAIDERDAVMTGKAEDTLGVEAFQGRRYVAEVVLTVDAHRQVAGNAVPVLLPHVVALRGEVVGRPAHHRRGRYRSVPDDGRHEHNDDAKPADHWIISLIWRRRESRSTM